MKLPSIALLLAAAIFPTGPLLADETAPSDFTEKVLRGMEKKGAEAIPPIVISPDARDFREVETAQQSWSERVLVRPALARFEARGDLAWKEDAVKFLREAPPLLFGERAIENPYQTNENGRRLVAAGCDDPAVLVLAALIDRLCGIDRRFVEVCATKALQAMEADPASKAILAYYANDLLAWAYHHGGFPKKRPGAVEKTIAAAVRMAEDGSFLPEEAEIYIRHLYRNTPSNELAAKMIGLAPKLPLPLWARQTIVGRSEITVAWASRGGGWASTVTDAGWQGFSEHLAKARVALVEAWKENPKAPFAAQSMIKVVMAGKGENGETVQLWFDRAIAAQCDYTPAYASVLWAYRPRWCGGHELMLAFGKACAATKRYDLDIPIAFTRACNGIVSEIDDWREFYQRPDIAEVLMELSEGFVREPSRQHQLKMRQSLLAVNAWLTGDFKRAASALADLGGPLHSESLSKLETHRVTEAEMREEIAIANSPVAADFKKALALYEEGKLGEAETLYRRIEPTEPGSVKDSIRERLLVIEIEKNLAGGDWVTLPVAADLRGWFQRGGNWSGTPEGTLVNTGNDTRGAIIHRARVGPDFEMRVQYSVDAKDKCCRRCDILFSWNDGIQEPYNVASHGQVGKAGAIAWIASKNQSSKDIKSVKIPYQESNLLLLHSENEKLTFTVNDKVAFRDLTPENLEFGPADGRIGIGSYRWCRMNVTRIGKIEVRRLGETAR
ncbi:MAG: hypothetical protein ACRDBP_03310 [Luteolibacter sp.]